MCINIVILKCCEESTYYYYKINAKDIVGLESKYSPVISGKTPLGPRAPEINETTVPIEVLEDSYDDQSINLYRLFKDLNNDPLTFRSEGNSHIQIMIYQNNGTVVLKPERNWNGYETITFYASDGEDEVSQDVMITVNPVNDPPEGLTIIEPQDGFEPVYGKGLNFTSVCYDPDLIYGDELNFSWTSNINDLIGTSQNLSEVILSPGSHLITLLVIDRGGLTSEAKIIITIVGDEETDSDLDGIPNIWETLNKLDPDNPKDAEEDFDNDRLTNLEEYKIGSDPNDPDSDKDGVDDGEDQYPLDNTKWEDKKQDSDKSDSNTGVIITVIAIVIIILILLLLFIKKPEAFSKLLRKGEEETEKAFEASKAENPNEARNHDQEHEIIMEY